MKLQMEQTILNIQERLTNIETRVNSLQEIITKNLPSSELLNKLILLEETKYQDLISEIGLIKSQIADLRNR